MSKAEVQRIYQTSETQQSRPRDYIYDGTYTVSSVKDHVNLVNKAVAQPPKSYPIYENMFSSLHQYPSHVNAIHQSKVNYNLGLPRNTRETRVDVGGKDRYLYFKRALVPYHPTVVSQLIYGRRPQTKGKDQKLEKEPPTKTISIQTVFRESYAQTDPFSPDFVLAKDIDPEKQMPELLSLASLTFQNGLPVSIAELDMIERARAKREWEKTLPEVVDDESFERRLKMMEEMEIIEWQEREREIERLQKIRLDILQKVIEEREAEGEQE
ncbi:hypothetical protein ROZALSC1DRAFT_20590, partial [Rozella allomycis CSF55]